MISNKTLTVLPFLAMSAAVLVSACGGGDTGGTGGGSGTASSSSVSGSTSGSTSGTASSSSSTSGSSTSTSTSTSSSSSGGGMGACTNPADKLALMDQAADKAAAQACGQMCALDPNQATCAKTCMVMKLKITDACGGCWGDVIACGIKNCFNECIGGPSAKCDTCTMTKCEPAFHTCSGV